MLDFVLGMEWVGVGLLTLIGLFVAIALLELASAIWGDRG